MFQETRSNIWSRRITLYQRYASCPKCGHLNPDYSRFCQSCGASLGPESFGQYHPSTTPSARQGISDVQKIIIVVAVILVVIIVVGAIAASFLLSLNSVSRTSSLSAPIVITGVNAQMNYANPSATYFGPQTQSLGGSGLPLQLQYGQSFYYGFSLRMGGLYQTHTIDSVYLSTPGFDLLSVSPTLPYAMSSGSSVTLTITGEAPSQNYYGAITIIISTH